MGLTAEEIEKIVDEQFPQARGLGWSLESVGDGRARLTLSCGEQHLRPGGSVSGPALMALADTAMFFAVLGVIGPKTLAVTTNLNIHFMRKFGAGVLAAEAEIMKRGSRLIVGQVTMSPADGGDTIAHATVTYSVPPTS